MSPEEWKLRKIFHEKVKLVRKMGASVYEKKGLYCLAIRAEQKGFGCFLTQDEAWRQSFQWFGLEPLTNDLLLQIKNQRSRTDANRPQTEQYNHGHKNKIA